MIGAYGLGDHMGPLKRPMAAVVGCRAICEVNSSLLALDGGNVSDVSQPSLETCFQAWKHKWKQSGNSRKQSETINIDKSLHVYTAVDVGRRV